MSASDQAFMEEAIRLARESIENGGGPFGAVIVHKGVIVGAGNNRVVPHLDPTAHAEVVAIRDACGRMQTHVLSECVLYTSCEPCPMCLAAAYWARIPLIYYGADRVAAAAADFDDSLIYDELALPVEQRQVKMIPCLPEAARDIFTAWQAKLDRTPY